MAMEMSQKKDIKKKMMAATSMLLVACIMLISASYAWFTLSTAPEITGITTTVGANGNLEIALADLSTWADPDGTVQSGVGTSSAKVDETVSNLTWGNLVDLSDSTFYGLSQMALMPARLNITGSNGLFTVSSTAPLMTPVYGADGRVSDLATNTMSSIFDKDSGKFPYVEGARGVRAIGSASAMSDRQNAYRNATTTLGSEMAAAKAEARNTIYNYGNELAELIIKKVVDDAATYSKEELAFLDQMIAGLRKAQTEIYQALEGAIIGMAASNTSAAIDTEVTALVTLFNGSDYTADGSTGYTVTTGGAIVVSNNTVATLPAGYADYYTELAAITTKLDAAVTAKDNLSESENAWSAVSGVLTNIVNPDKVKINGSTADELKADMGKLLTAVQAGLEIQMPDDSGVYSDIAKYTGNYSAGIVMEDIQVEEMGIVNKLEANMTTTVSGTSVLDQATAAIATAGYPENNNAADADTVLTDKFGYALDFYLRTNAANSNLLLQIDEAQRVYSDSKVEQTQGGGSNMTFTTADVGTFSVNTMKKLMGAIRVVFLDGEGEVLKFAKLDMTEANLETTNTSVTADLKLVESFAVENGKVTLGNLIENTTNADGTVTNKQIITALPQNEALKLTAMVYLDGDAVTNAMVANALTSMTGSMNLQFASSATLVPMSDTAYEQGTNFQN